MFWKLCISNVFGQPLRDPINLLINQFPEIYDSNFRELLLFGRNFVELLDRFPYGRFLPLKFERNSNWKSTRRDWIVLDAINERPSPKWPKIPNENLIKIPLLNTSHCKPIIYKKYLPPGNKLQIITTENYFLIKTFPSSQRRSVPPKKKRNNTRHINLSHNKFSDLTFFLKITEFFYWNFFSSRPFWSMKQKIFKN